MAKTPGRQESRASQPSTLQSIANWFRSFFTSSSASREAIRRTEGKRKKKPSKSRLPPGSSATVLSPAEPPLATPPKKPESPVRTSSRQPSTRARDESILQSPPGRAPVGKLDQSLLAKLSEIKFGLPGQVKVRARPQSAVSASGLDNHEDETPALRYYGDQGRPSEEKERRRPRMTSASLTKIDRVLSPSRGRPTRGGSADYKPAVSRGEEETRKPSPEIQEAAEDPKFLKSRGVRRPRRRKRYNPTTRRTKTVDDDTRKMLEALEHFEKPMDGLRQTTLTELWGPVQEKQPQPDDKKQDRERLVPKRAAKRRLEPEPELPPVLAPEPMAPQIEPDPYTILPDTSVTDPPEAEVAQQRVDDSTAASVSDAPVNDETSVSEELPSIQCESSVPSKRITASALPSSVPGFYPKFEIKAPAENVEQTDLEKWRERATRFQRLPMPEKPPSPETPKERSPTTGVVQEHLKKPSEMLKRRK